MKLEYEVEGGEKKKKTLAPANEVKNVVVANWGPVPRDGGWSTILWNRRLSDFKEKYDTVISEESKLITSVDLSSVSSCRKMEELIIVGNDLNEIDLSPLSNFPHLKLLDLRFNNLKEVDLTPLAACPELREIDLSYNQLREADLSALPKCKDLEILKLSFNELKELDLTPISACRNLKELHLDRNEIERLDLSNLASCPLIGRVDLRENKINELSLYPLIGCSELWNPENMDRTYQLYPFMIDDNPIQEIDVSPLLLRGDHILRSSSSLKRCALKIFAPFYYRLMRKNWRCKASDFSLSISVIPWNELQKLLRINFDILKENERWRFIDVLLREMGFKSHSWENSDIDHHLLSLPSNLEYHEVIDAVSAFLAENNLHEKQSKGASSIYPVFEYAFEDIKNGSYTLSSSAPIPDIPKISELTFVVDNGIRAYQNLSSHWIRNCYDKYSVPADEVPFEETIAELGKSGDPEAPLILISLGNSLLERSKKIRDVWRFSIVDTFGVTASDSPEARLMFQILKTLSKFHDKHIPMFLMRVLKRAATYDMTRDNDFNDTLIGEMEYRQFIVWIFRMLAKYRIDDPRLQKHFVELRHDILRAKKLASNSKILFLEKTEIAIIASRV